MVVESVNLNPCLRPWQRAGVEFLLADTALAAPYSLCIAAPVVVGGRIGAGQGTAANGAAGAPAGGAPSASPVSSTYGTHGSHHGVARPAQGATDYAAQAGRTGNVPSGGGRSQPSRQADSFSGSPAVGQGQEARSANPVNLANQTQRYSGNQALPHIPPTQWPALWQERLKKTAPATVLWTYWALGEDMCVRPNPTRRALLQKLLADLGHPAGTHSFWPTALPHSLDTTSAQAAGQKSVSAPVPVQNTAFVAESAAAETLLYPAPDIFWSGVQLLKARAVVVMGSPALKALELPPRLRPFQQTRHNGMLIVVLRDVDFLAQEVHRYDAVKAFLRQALAPFGR